MTFIDQTFPAASPERNTLRKALYMDEAAALRQLVNSIDLSSEVLHRIEARAISFVKKIRETEAERSGIDSLLQEFALSTDEGIALMCLAEALLRIPDSTTADKLIKDKVATADWEKHLGQSDKLLVNASAWTLMLTGKVLRLDNNASNDMDRALRRIVTRSGEPVIRQAITQAMRILGRQFVMGRTIDEALERAKTLEARGYRYSYDMLGEAARTMADADRYFESYRQAIVSIAKASHGRGPIEGPGISVKLSALHPRYEFAQKQRVIDELTPRLISLARQAAAANIGFCVDAEEAERLDLSLDLIKATALDSSLGSWQGFGLAVQAYQKRAPYVIDWLIALAREAKRPLCVRLVKGAYWDTEIKQAQVNSLPSYPVFTRKVATDVSYLACAQRLLGAGDLIFPQFATHNAHTLSAILEFANAHRDYEFQRLHGMGESLYEQIVDTDKLNRSCRIYAPVGSHEDLLAYLVRRLLENGANTSFVNRIAHAELPIERLVEDPIQRIHNLDYAPHPRIPLPSRLYGDERRNSKGLDLNDPLTVETLAQDMAVIWENRHWDSHDTPTHGTIDSIHDPTDTRRIVGKVIPATIDDVHTAVTKAAAAQPEWNERGAEARALILDRIADLYESHMVELMTLAVREAGKTLPDAIAEVREAVDFCRYYALRARTDFTKPELMPGPTGERNTLSLQGRGAFVCISPWNFPLAIFTGQIAAALAAGNTVLAKPAEQTPLIAGRAVALMYKAGIPKEVLHLLPGSGEDVGAPLVRDPRIAGVAFTGSTQTAWNIAEALAQRQGPIIPFIAETGGQNAMIVDSSALPEQVVADVVTSAFRSTGQRCSALRVLFLQEDIADHIETMLAGAMAELVVGDPGHLATDVGPVIDKDAQEALSRHLDWLAAHGRLIAQTPLPDSAEHGWFVAPTAYAIDRIDQLTQENFGPILHVIRYRGDQLNDIIHDINATGYGLTLGIHTRIDSAAHYIASRVHVGNIYVNRTIIGATVGVQPFGGEGLSGTGPKAGGPHYLPRFATERTLSINTAAAGGNASLLALSEEP
ncbi:MAG: bifunctional proline dehydrogenase/L-glutamate gamma-semialdehyde dehydrogenase PutA [Alphaproteobacteria bacterium]